MLATLDPGVLDRLWFPLGEQTKDETRAQAAAAGLAVARRPESQEACFLGGDDYRAFLGPQRARAQPPARSSTRAAPQRRDARRLLALHARSAPRSRASPRPSRSTPSRRAPRRTPSSSARAPRSRARRVTVRGRLDTAATPRVEAKLRHRSPAVDATVVETPHAASSSLLDEPAFGVAPRADRGPLRRTTRSSAQASSSASSSE